MMKKPFCCDASRQMYLDYYRGQNGRGGIPVFIGHRGQRGHGLGSILSGFFRFAFPLIKKGLGFVSKQLGKQALSTGYDIVKDIAEGKPLGEAAKTRVKETINQYIPGAFPQSGSGSRRRRTSYKLKGRKKKKKTISRKAKFKRTKRNRKDILD